MERLSDGGRVAAALLVCGALGLYALIAASPATAAGRCGVHPWCDTSLSSDARAGLLLGVLTQDEKVALLGGDDPFSGFTLPGGTGHTGADFGVPRVGLPPVYYTDGPVGPRQGAATAMPVPMALAATFDTTLAQLHGSVVGNEAKSKGNDVVFGPTVNIMRTPLGGRTYEAYGEDPYLVSRMAVGWIQGLQSQGVIANVKHFAANNQEGADPTGQLGRPGSPLGAGVVGIRYLENSVIDERTLREIYLPQFEAAVKEAHVGTVMCSYNQVDGQYACENEHLLEQILRREWGFNGYVLADYGAAHNTIASLNNGLDFEPWPPAAYQPPEIQAALAAHMVSTSTLDEHVRNMLRTLFAFGFFDRNAYTNDDHQIDKPAHAQAAQRIEQSAITLLRNNGVLPLDASKLKSIAVIGKDANQFVTGGGSGGVTPFQFVSPLAGIRDRVGPGVSVSYSDGSDAAAASAAAKAADVAIVVAGDYDTEGADRACLTLECPNSAGDQDSLISSVAASNPRTIVVLETGGPDLTPWRSQVAGLLEAWYPGEMAGKAIASVLFGDADPGGRLPVTFPQHEADTPTSGDQSKYPGVLNTVTYKEGVFVGYRWYDAHNLTPAYPFGYGLSYTTFRYSDLRIDNALASPRARRRAGQGATPRATPGAVATVSLSVTNTGSRAGVAVPQLYLGLPSPDPSVPQPPRQLRSFAKVSLDPGQTARISFPINERAFSYWDANASDWAVAPGCYAVMAGSSSRDLPLTGTIARGGSNCGAGSVTVGQRACASRHLVVIRLPARVRGAGVRSIVVLVNGRRVASLRGRRASVRLRLRGRPVGRVRVRLDVRTARGRFAISRTYTTCTLRAARG